MKHNIGTHRLSAVCLVILLAACSPVPTLVPQEATAPAPAATVTPLPAPATTPAQPVPTATSASAPAQAPATVPAVPTGEVPAARGWREPPPCANQPLDLAGWQNAFQQGAADPRLLRQLSAVAQQTPALSFLTGDLTAGSLFSLLEAEQASGAAASVPLALLWLNVLDGRLSLASQITLPDLPAIKTVQDLTAALALPPQSANGLDALTAAAQAVLSDQGIVQPVCGHLVYLRQPNTIVAVTWGADGVRQHTVYSQTVETDEPGVFTRLVPAPDYAYLALETRGYESGGELYLFDLRTHELSNLNAQVDLALAPGGPPTAHDARQEWEVIGWHPDSRGLLVAAAHQPFVFQVDLDGKLAQRIPLPGDEANAGHDTADLSPDGSGFVYIAFDGSTNSNQLNFYDLASGQVTTWLSRPAGEGRLSFPRFSPDGRYVAYLWRSGHPTSEVHVALRLFDVTAGADHTLVDAHVGLAEPVWSPDARSLIYDGAALDMPPGLVFPGDRMWRGQLWRATLESSAGEQVTFMPLPAYQPAWSIDGRLLAFVTRDDSIGLKWIDQSGMAWKIELPPAAQDLISLAFLP